MPANNNQTPQPAGALPGGEQTITGPPQASVPAAGMSIKAGKPSVKAVLRDHWLFAPQETKIGDGDKLSDLWNTWVHKEEYAKPPVYYGAGQLAQALNKAYSEWSWVTVDDTKSWQTVQDALKVL